MRALIFLSLAVSLFADEFPKPFNSGAEVGKKPMPSDEAVKLIKMPEGFKATVFAAEPDVQNPIACAWDSRGRLWIAENYSYAEASVGFDKRLRDRIVIFEDTDNDGRHDKRTVFADNLFNLTSIELGYGGVFATAAPYLLWIPDADGDDKPDAPKDKKAASFPSLLSFPSLNGTSTRILLDGFDAGGVHHNFVNGLRWGPDGWLYGRHGIQATSKVGKPGTPDAERLAINVGIWRWNPTRHTVEMVTYGGTNPWGLDFNAEGEGFFTNTVTGHLYHMIPGAHYERMYGEDPNPYIYQLLPQTADHYHYDRSQKWTASRDGKANDLGGGHAHVGCMIYQGENWPEQYRGKLFTLNLHGRRINVNRLERKGSGYVGKSEPDMIFFGDPWFRGIELTYGPDGGVYILDWSDQGECHENDGVHRESGRIYKITFGEVKRPEWLGAERSDRSDRSDRSATANTQPGGLPDSSRGLSEERATPPDRSQNGTHPGRGDGAANRLSTSPSPHPGCIEPPSEPGVSLAPLAQPPATVQQPSGLGAKGDLASLPNTPLIEKSLIGNEWESRIATQLLRERMVRGEADKDIYMKAIKSVMAKHPKTPLMRRFNPMAFWFEMKSSSEKSEAEFLTQIDVAITMARSGMGMPDEPLLAPEIIRSDHAGFLTRNKNLKGFLPLWSELLNHPEDAADHILPIHYWSGFERIVSAEGATVSTKACEIAYSGKIPLILENTARRLATDLATKPDRLDGLLALANAAFDEAKAASILRGISFAVRGMAKAKAPANWPVFAAQAAKFPALADNLRSLNVIFGDGRALDEIRALALDSKAELASRKQAIESLIAAKPADLRATLESLVKNSNDLLPNALQGMAAFDDAGPLIAQNYTRVRPDFRPGVLTALCSRPAFATALLDAVAEGKIARNTVTPYHARQIAALADAAVSKRLAEVWGSVATTSEQKKKRIAEIKAALPPDVLAKADISNGRALYTQTCAACHTLFDLGQAGTNLGPNLTGSGRGDINYLLENIVDPSAIVPADYKLSTVTMKDGRVLSGFISTQNAQTLTLRTMTETQTLDRSTVAKTEASAQSLMPEGILDALKPEQIRDLFGFLMKK